MYIKKNTTITYSYILMVEILPRIFLNTVRETRYKDDYYFFSSKKKKTLLTITPFATQIYVFCRQLSFSFACMEWLQIAPSEC